jgi:hypothetical protein
MKADSKRPLPKGWRWVRLEGCARAGLKRAIRGASLGDLMGFKVVEEA